MDHRSEHVASIVAIPPVVIRGAHRRRLPSHHSRLRRVVSADTAPASETSEAFWPDFRTLLISRDGGDLTAVRAARAWSGQVHLCSTTGPSRCPCGDLHQSDDAFALRLFVGPDQDGRAEPRVGAILDFAVIPSPSQSGGLSMPTVIVPRGQDWSGVVDGVSYHLMSGLYEPGLLCYDGAEATLILKSSSRFEFFAASDTDCRRTTDLVLEQLAGRLDLDDAHFIFACPPRVKLREVTETIARVQERHHADASVIWHCPLTTDGDFRLSALVAQRMGPQQEER